MAKTSLSAPGAEPAVTAATTAAAAPLVSVVDRIFEYENYRLFLADFFNEQRRIKPQFSLRFFAHKAGFSSHTFCDNIIKGNRNLSRDSIPKMVAALSLEGASASFFETLVHYNQAKTAAERALQLKELSKIRSGLRFYRIQEQQYAYYRYWYLPVIRELAVYVDWQDDYRLLGSLMRPKLTAAEVKSAVETLVDIGILTKDAAGCYHQTSTVVTSEGIPGHIIKAARSEYLLRAIEAAETLPPERRHMAYATIAMNRNTYEIALQKLDELRREILAMAAEDSDVDSVYCMSTQLFPLVNSSLRALEGKIR